MSLSGLFLGGLPSDSEAEEDDAKRTLVVPTQARQRREDDEERAPSLPGLFLGLPTDSKAEEDVQDTLDLAAACAGLTDGTDRLKIWDGCC